MKGLLQRGEGDKVQLQWGETSTIRSAPSQGLGQEVLFSREVNKARKNQLWREG